LIDLNKEEILHNLDLARIKAFDLDSEMAMESINIMESLLSINMQFDEKKKDICIRMLNNI